MRRKDREITDFYSIIDVLSRCDTIRLGISGKEYPYVVPLSFGFEAENGKISLYIHGAQKGFKHELLKLDGRVCVEADICHRFLEFRGSITAEYESIIGFGSAVVLENKDEAAHGLRLLLEHCGYGDFAYDPTELDTTKVYKIELDSITGKHMSI